MPWSGGGHQFWPHVKMPPRWHVATCRRGWCQEAILEMRRDITFISWHPPWEGPSKSSWKTHWSFGFGYLVVKSHYDHQQQFGNIISSHSCSRAVIWSHLLRCHGQSPGNRSCFCPSLYLTAACKNYKAISLKTWILLSDCAWRSVCLFFYSQRSPTWWGTHPSFRQNWVFQTPKFLMLKPRMV